MTERIIDTQVRQGLYVEVYIIEGEPGIHHRVKGHVCDTA